ncbi:MAG: tRNA guanosine(15) transglycosylase TgtA [Candidatus Bathyarchaeia archaeon]
MLKFEIKDRDAAGRLASLSLRTKRISTPVFLPVYNPHIPTIAPKEMERDFGIEAIMVNAYLIYKDPVLKELALRKGIRGLLDFDGAIFSDSGAYQTFRGQVPITQSEILRFQSELGVDVGVMLDVPSRHESRSETMASVLATIERAEEWNRIIGEMGGITPCWEGTIQGGAFEDLVRLSCLKMRRFPFDLFAVGVPPKLWKNYAFKEIVLQGLTAKRSLPFSKPLHAFGMGNPIVLPILVAIGYDIFDSASYSLYAKDGRYMTEFGTKKLEELSYFPCQCPICIGHTPEEIRSLPSEERTKLLAKHNLYTILREVKTIRQAIVENNLWELVQQRARAHPKLLEALFEALRKGRGLFEELDPIWKRSAFMYSGPESLHRIELKRAFKRLKARLSATRFKVPSALRGVYPFGQAIVPKGIFQFEEGGKPESSLEIVRVIADYQFGSGVGRALFPEEVEVELSKATGRIRRVWLGKQLLATIAPRDGFLRLRFLGALRLHKALASPSYRVVLKEDVEVEEIVAKGGNVFARFVSHCDPRIIPREEALVTDSKDRLLAVGQALLSGKEMTIFRYGLALKTRDCLGNFMSFE